VTTGQVDALESDDELETLIRRHGGRMSYVVSGKTSFVVAGHEPSEIKLAAARELNVRILDADGLFELIRTSPEGGVAAAADTLAPGEIGTVYSMIKRLSLCESPCFCDLFGQFYTYCILFLCAFLLADRRRQSGTRTRPAERAHVVHLQGEIAFSARRRSRQRGRVR
jgi:hypothetical protein